MRVLWFTGMPCNYSLCKTGGGGWMPELQDELKAYCIDNNENIELAICFPVTGEAKKEVRDGVTYYLASEHKKAVKDKIKDLLCYKDLNRDEIRWQYYIDQFKRVIEDYKPDVIEVFGSEVYIGLSVVAARELSVPTLLHVQGLLSLYIYIYMPTGVSPISYYLSKGLRNMMFNFQTYLYWKRSIHREKAILRAATDVIGRTHWDRQALAIINPEACYHYGGELLRKPFYIVGERQIPQHAVITTTSSNALYKGFDLILKVANILKNECHLDFIWNVYGDVDTHFFEKIAGVRHQDVNVVLRGRATAQQLHDEMLRSTVYVQPSYTENSPNSLAEAQITGLPAVATNIGGTSSMLRDGVDGYLYPPTDPYMGAYYIQKLLKDKELNISMGKSAQAVAMQRHDRRTIVSELVKLYKELAERRK